MKCNDHIGILTQRPRRSPLGVRINKESPPGFGIPVVTLGFHWTTSEIKIYMYVQVLNNLCGATQLSDIRQAVTVSAMASSDESCSDSKSTCEGSSGRSNQSHSGAASDSDAEVGSDGTSTQGHSASGQSHGTDGASVSSHECSASPVCSAGGVDGKTSNASGSSSRTSTESGSSAENGSVTPPLAPVRPPKALLETNEQHSARHIERDPSCARCIYLQTSQKVQAMCTFYDTTLREDLCYIIEQPHLLREPWGLGCWVCRAEGGRTTFAKCRVNSLNLVSRPDLLARHAASDGHALALQAHKARTRPENIASGCGIEDSEVGEEQPGDFLELPSGCPVGHEHIMSFLENAHEQGSFARWARTMQVHPDVHCPGNTSRTVAGNLLSMIAGYVMHLTLVLLLASSSIAIIQDAREENLLILARMVIWHLPDPARQALSEGLLNGVWAVGSHGPPWVAERVLGVARSGSDRSGQGHAAEVLHVMRVACSSDKHFQDVCPKVMYFTPDNAADEIVCGTALQSAFKNLRYYVPDSTHSIQLAIKNGCKGEPLVEKAQQVLLTNKRPNPSAANLLRNSKRFRSKYSQGDAEEVLSTCQHLGYAPQRMSSRARPFGRIARGVRRLFGALADEADSGPEKHAASTVLRAAANYPMLMVAGLLGDLCHEHHKLVRETDEADPDPTCLRQQLVAFGNRVKVLFTDGQIMAGDMRDTFTYQIVHLFKNPDVLVTRRHAYLFLRPTTDQALFEPLQRFRVVVGNVLACLQAAMPECAWQVEFEVWNLPSAFGSLLRAGDARRRRTQDSVKKRLMRIFKTGGKTSAGDDTAGGTTMQELLADAEKVFQEWLELVPAAEKYKKLGLSTRASWASASRDFPELKHGRAFAHIHAQNVLFLFK